MQVVTLIIDSLEISSRDDQSVLQAARARGINIPTLCYLEGIASFGACRLCIVDVEGVENPLPACLTQVKDGMAIHTESARLRTYRRTIVEGLFTEGNHVCSICVSNGHCELQEMGRRLGIEHVSLLNHYPKRSVDASHPRFGFDANRCIMCERCIRLCAEVEHARCKGVKGRGFASEVITDLNQPWGEATSCTGCGKCVQVCPTGALFEKGKSAGEMTKHKEFLTFLAEGGQL